MEGNVWNVTFQYGTFGSCFLFIFTERIYWMKENGQRMVKGISFKKDILAVFFQDHNLLQFRKPFSMQSLYCRSVCDRFSICACV